MTASEEGSLRELLVELGKRLYQRGYVAANDGNLSVRLDDRYLLSTPTGVSKGFMSPSDMVKIDLATGTYEGLSRPSTELKMHQAIYRVREDVRAVVHAHPPYATAYAVAGVPLEESILAEVIISLGSIPLAEYRTPSTEAFAENVSQYAKRYDAILLANHGAVTVGADLMQAHFRMETLEHFAKINFISRAIGPPQSLSFDQVRELMELRSMYAQGAAERCVHCPHFEQSSHHSMSAKAAQGGTDRRGTGGESAVDIRAIVQRVLERLGKQ